MDIFDFVDSKSIRKHLKSLNYCFSPLEKAFLISTSRNATIKQKHNAFKELIAIGEDETISYRPNTIEYPSLLSLLKRYMTIENEIVSEFFDTKEAIFRYRYLCSNDSSYCEDFQTVYPNFEKCEKAFKEDIESYGWDVNLRFFEIKMDSLKEIGKSITLKFNPNNELLEIETTLLEEEKFDILNAFEGMWFDIPTPFKRGDILISRRENLLYKDENPVVLDSLSTWDKNECIKNGCIKTEQEAERCEYLHSYLKINGDISDMNVRGYFGCLDGTFYWEVSHCILDYDYYEGTYDGGYRILKVLSDYIKGVLDLAELVKLANYISKEEELKDSKRYIHLTEECLKTLGFK